MVMTAPGTGTEAGAAVKRRMEGAMTQEITHGLWGGSVALLALALFQNRLVSAARKANPNLRYWDLIVTSEDNRYSLSRLQFYLWFAVIAISYAAVCAASGTLSDVPANLYVLMGINAASAVASTAIALKNEALTKRQAAEAPHWFRDIFLDSQNTLDLPRTQMFMWTLVILVGYLVALVSHFKRGQLTLPVLPEGLLVLMGISQGAYLGSKAVEDTGKK